MIKIDIKENLIKINGHAKFASYGKDIVCASVSSIVYTTINAILNFDSEAITYNETDSIDIIINKKDNITITLIDNMITLLEELASLYKQNIKISRGE